MSNKSNNPISNIFLALFVYNHIGIITIILVMIIGIFIWGYYKFAKPVYDEDDNLGYGPYETVWVDENTGRKIPKSELYKYPEIYDNLH